MEYIGNIKYDTILYEDRKFVIYGYGFYGKKLYELMQTMGIENKVVAFCDANAENLKNEVYTIVEEKDGWGKLKSGTGWIKLSYAKKV